MTSYWTWFFRGSGGRPGICRYWDRWLLFHLAVGLFLAWLVPVSLEDGAKGLLLPVAGVFIGLSFAWGGNAQALLESPEVHAMVAEHPGGFEEYVYTFQSAILFLLLTLVLWALAGLGIFDRVWPTQASLCAYRGVGALLYLLASLSVRECWHVVLGAQWFLVARYKIQKNNGRGSKPRNE